MAKRNKEVERSEQVQAYTEALYDYIWNTGEIYEKFGREFFRRMHHDYKKGVFFRRTFAGKPYPPYMKIVNDIVEFAIPFAKKEGIEFLEEMELDLLDNSTPLLKMVYLEYIYDGYVDYFEAEEKHGGWDDFDEEWSDDWFVTGFDVLPTSAAEWKGFVDRIDSMLKASRYKFATQLLKGIREVVVATEHVTRRQKKAIDNVQKSETARRNSRLTMDDFDRDYDTDLDDEW